MINIMDKEVYSIKKELFIMDNLKMIRKMVKEYLSLEILPNMRVSSKIINSTEKEN